MVNASAASIVEACRQFDESAVDHHGYLVAAIAFSHNFVRHYHRSSFESRFFLPRQHDFFVSLSQQSVMQLKEAQDVVDEWIGEIGGYWDKFQILAQLMEELGEVSAALQRQEGLRPREVHTDLEGEVGDLTFTLMAFANVMGLDLEQCLNRTMQKYKTRDAQAWINAPSNQSE